MKKLTLFSVLLLLALSLQAQNKKITILSTNDMHAQIEYFPQFAALADSLRAIDPELIVLGAGDNRTGNPYNDRADIPGMPMVELMNAVGFNASAIGNHEWDNGWDGFRTLVNAANFPHVCCNINVPDTMRLHIPPYRFLQAHGVKVGILGAIQTGSLGIPDCHPDKVQGITFVQHDSAIVNYEWMRSQCDVLLLLSHDGYEDDVKTAERYGWFDLIIGGHTHTLVPANDVHNGVLISQDKNKFYYATVTHIEVADGHVVSKTNELINVRGFNSKNEKIAEMVAGFSQNPSLKVKVGTIEKDLHNTEELGSLMADADLELTGSDIALQNGGGVRFETFDAGDITLGDVLKLDPFGNHAIVCNFTGREVADFIIACYNKDEKQLPFVAGISYELTIDRATNTATDVKITMLNGKKFDLKHTYRFVTNSYVTALIPEGHKDKGTDTYEACSDLLVKYLQKKGSVDYQGVKRVTVIEK